MRISVQEIGEAVRLGCCCFSMLLSLARGVPRKRTISLAGRTYEIRVVLCPPKVEIEPVDN